MVIGLRGAASSSSESLSTAPRRFFVAGERLLLRLPDFERERDRDRLLDPLPDLWRRLLAPTLPLDLDLDLERLLRDPDLDFRLPLLLRDRLRALPDRERRLPDRERRLPDRERRLPDRERRLPDLDFRLPLPLRLRLLDLDRLPLPDFRLPERLRLRLLDRLPLPLRDRDLDLDDRPLTLLLDRDDLRLRFEATDLDLDLRLPDLFDATLAPRDLAGDLLPLRLSDVSSASAALSTSTDLSLLSTASGDFGALGDRDRLLRPLPFPTASSDGSATACSSPLSSFSSRDLFTPFSVTLSTSAVSSLLTSALSVSPGAGEGDRTLSTSEKRKL
jgi:hypothetical protein